ncbi:MAG: hypothetical protein JWN50_808 [Parcubacteria group bacterium]|nr:hypothetical protein [Parcubacteria group bacterium]
MSTLSTLFVRNLVISGVHGSTGRETFDPQRFKIDIDIELDIARAAESDSIHDTYDYKDAAVIARHIIEHERHVLIEKIGSRIASRISEDPKVSRVQVRLSKLDASELAVPGIIVSKKRNPQELDRRFLSIDVKDLIERIDKEQGVSIPFLTDAYRKLLLEEAETYTYEKQPEIVGPAKVHEQLSSIREFHEGSLFYGLKGDVQRLLQGELRKIGLSPFTPELGLNEMSLQLYEKGSIGITPHVDGKSCVNLICIFILTGHAKFALCDDRSGANPRFLDTTPGNLVIFRAPGFKGSDFRPFHFLSDITERRIVFGLRQKV